MSNSNEVEMRFLAEPGDVNFGGKAHGGAVMKWIDQAGYACAVGWSGNYCVTVYVGGIRFLQPIHIGDLCEVRASLIHTGKTSMHISIDVHATDLRKNEFRRCTHCIIIFVCVDENGIPRPVKQWTPVTENEKRLENYAIRLMELRKAIGDEMNIQK